jgi:uncharacterized membrane protein YbjE (DUF340 family)
MDPSPKKYRWNARSGLILGPVAWVTNQQVTSELTYAKCEAVSSTLVVVCGVVCACVAIAGLGLSWSARHRAPADSTTSFIATLGALAAAMFLLVIIAGTIAGLLLPGCFR